MRLVENATFSSSDQFDHTHVCNVFAALKDGQSSLNGRFSVSRGSTVLKGNNDLG